VRASIARLDRARRSAGSKRPLRGASSSAGRVQVQLAKRGRRPGQKLVPLAIPPNLANHFGCRARERHDAIQPVEHLRPEEMFDGRRECYCGSALPTLLPTKARGSRDVRPAPRSDVRMTTVLRKSASRPPVGKRRFAEGWQQTGRRTNRRPYRLHRANSTLNGCSRNLPVSKPSAPNAPATSRGTATGSEISPMSKACVRSFEPKKEIRDGLRHLRFCPHR